jgi:hypothetical protein
MSPPEKSGTTPGRRALPFLVLSPLWHHPRLHRSDRPTPRCPDRPHGPRSAAASRRPPALTSRAGPGQPCLRDRGPDGSGLGVEDDLLHGDPPFVEPHPTAKAAGLFYLAVTDASDRAARRRLQSALESPLCPSPMSKTSPRSPRARSRTRRYGPVPHRCRPPARWAGRSPLQNRRISSGALPLPVRSCSARNDTVSPSDIRRAFSCIRGPTTWPDPRALHHAERTLFCRRLLDVTVPHRLADFRCHCRFPWRTWLIDCRSAPR